MLKRTCAGLAALILLAAMPAAAQTGTTSYRQATLEQVQVDAARGVAMAQYEMGRRSYYNKTMKDDVQALQWFLKAASQDVPQAQYEAATMYVLGEGTAKDAAQAMIWYRKAAALGYVAANFDIGLMYVDGEGVAADNAEAARWFRTGAELGEKRCQYRLAILYRDGRGVPQDGAEAVKWFRTAVRQRFVAAAEALEAMYRDGQGVDKDPVTSHAWRTMAAYLRDSPTGESGPNHPLFAILSTPKLSLDDNIRAWDMYDGFMHEMGFVTDDKPGPDGHTAKDAAHKFLSHPSEDGQDKG